MMVLSAKTAKTGKSAKTVKTAKKTNKWLKSDKYQSKKDIRYLLMKQL